MKQDQRNNLNIQFKKFFAKRDNDFLIDAFQKIDMSVFDADVCRKILKTLNTEEDSRVFEDFTGDISTLDDMSKFFI